MQIQQTPAIYIDFWGPTWQPQPAPKNLPAFTDAGGYSASAAINYLTAFFQAVGGSSWLASQTQYCQGSGSAPVQAGGEVCPSGAQFIENLSGMVKAVWNDPSAVNYANSTWSPNFAPNDIITSAKNAENYFLNHGYSMTADSEIIVMPSPGCLQNQSCTPGTTNWLPGMYADNVCAFHSWYQDSQSPAVNVTYTYLPYLPDVGMSCGQYFANSPPGDSFGHGWFDGFSIVGGHEVAETITDPDVVSGWQDPVSLNGGENGDKCDFSQVWPPANAAMGNNYFAVQPLWSNALGGCAYGLQASDSAGGVLTSAPAAASMSPNRLEVVVRGTDGALWHTYYTGAWAGWDSLGGGVMANTRPAAVSWGTNRIDVFVEGTDQGLWHKWWDGSAWSGWESLGGVLTAGPTVTTWGPGRLDVLVRGADGAVWHKWYAGAWSGWESQGGVAYAGTGPGAVAWAPGRIDLFVAGTDKNLWHKWYDGGWSGWERLTSDGRLTSAPSAASYAKGRLDVYATDASGAALHEWWWSGISDRWNGFSSAYGSWSSDLAAVSRATNEVDLLGRDSSNALRHYQI